MPVNRRSFIKSLGIGAAGLSLNNFLLTAQQSNKFKDDVNRNYLPDLQVDVIVIGAGPSGIPAAMAAAREGAKVILLEEDTTPGGAPVNMYVTFMCGAPRTGIYLETVRQLNKNHSLGIEPSKTFGDYAWDNKNHWWLPSSYSRVWNAMLSAQKNITLMCGCRVIDAIVSTKGNRNTVTGVVMMRNELYQRVLAPVTIDATGTGLVSAKAGCNFFYGSDAKSDFNESIGLEKSDGKVQPCTQMFISQRTKSNTEFPRSAFNTGVLLYDDPKWEVHQTPEEAVRKDAGIYLHWGSTVHVEDTTDIVQVAAAQMEALNRLKPRLEALQKAGYATHMAPKIGVRECRRIQGEYVVTVDDVINGVFQDDHVADAWYALDPWGMKIEEKVKLDVKPYGIPYRSLIPLNTEGLLTAGRIISGTRLAMSSYRVQPICGTIGEAAGTAAAMAANKKTGVRNIDIRQLQRKLEAAGLFDWYGHVNLNVNNKPWRK
ncbi:MAG: FAD-dependent oxidoreductase [Eubacteriales bacterium]|nr:FAD-dependent oxidoreductase [Eubacteriales bacterium]